MRPIELGATQWVGQLVEKTVSIAPLYPLIEPVEAEVPCAKSAALMSTVEL
jgi:hypothetical protein